MKKTCISYCIIVFWVCSVCVEMIHAAPKIEFVEGTTFDFGDVRPNEFLEHAFAFKNIGDEGLKIAEQEVKDG